MSLALADRPIAEVIRFFSERGVEVGLLVPTETGLRKSIMDAHAHLREYLKAKALHDYEAQGQGQEAKKVSPAFIVTTTIIETKASFYRPETKSGDPRLWISMLPYHAKAGNVLALLVADGVLYVVNASDRELLKTADSPDSPLGALFRRLAPHPDGPVSELLGMLGELSKRGFIESLRSGPTGVGFTLETHLGIAANSSRKPDFLGIELKASRVERGGKPVTRTTLFSKIPDWKSSALDSADKLLQSQGYLDGSGRRQLYCSMNHQPNSLGLFLSVDDENDILHARHQGQARPEDMVRWNMGDLRAALKAKHPATMWVKAEVRKRSDGREEFWYFAAELTSNPMTVHLAPLLSVGLVELDFTLSHKVTASGGTRVRDHGYLFKMWSQQRSMLFPVTARYDLSA